MVNTVSHDNDELAITLKDHAPAELWAFNLLSTEDVPTVRNGIRVGATTALVLLGYAHLADRALFSTQGYTFTTLEEVSALTRTGIGDVMSRTKTLVNLGVLIEEHKRHPNGNTTVVGYRVSEDAFR